MFRIRSRASFQQLGIVLKKTLSKRILNPYSVRRRFSNSLIAYNINGENDSVGHIPWYLRIEDDSLRNLNEQPKDKTVIMPENAPNSLLQIIKNLKDKLAMRDIVIFDLKQQRETDESNHRLKSCDYVIICTALSPKHCDKTFVEINKLLKNQYKVNGYVEGNMNPNDEKKRLKRLARKTNLGKANLKKSNVNVNDEDSWYMVDCKVDRIFLNILTASRRSELNLEELYAPNDEKYVYTNKISSSPGETNMRSYMNNVADEDNILAALRNLAQQRRKYSTNHMETPLCNYLMKQNFKAVDNLLKDDQKLKLELLPLAVRAMEQLKDAKKNEDINVIGFLNLIKRNTPLQLCKIPNFWDNYRSFLILLFEIDPTRYGSRSLEKDYFGAKRSLGETLTSNDLDFLVELVQNKSKKKDYWNLVKENNEIIKVLELFNEDIIFSDANLAKLLKTLEYTNEKIKLHSFYEVVNFLVDKFDREIPPQTLNEIMKILINCGDIKYLIKLWQIKLGYRPGEYDNRPWVNLIHLILESSNENLIKIIIENGILLDMKRSNIIISKELRDCLISFFLKVDPDNLKYNELRKLLLE